MVKIMELPRYTLVNLTGAPMLLPSSSEPVTLQPSGNLFGASQSLVTTLRTIHGSFPTKAETELHYIDPPEVYFRWNRENLQELPVFVVKAEAARLILLDIRAKGRGSKWYGLRTVTIDETLGEALPPMVQSFARVDTFSLYEG